MKTHELIQDLSGKLEPVRPRSFARRVGLALAVGGAFLAVLFFLFHHRPDLTSAARSPEFLSLQTLLLVAAGLSLVCFAKLEVPGARLSAFQLLPLAVLVLAAITFPLFRFLHPTLESQATEAMVSAFHCATTVAAASAVLAAGLMWLARTQAPTRPMASGALAVLASVAIGALAVDLSCPNDHPLHLLFFHLLVPCLAVLAVLLPLTRKILRW